MRGKSGLNEDWKLFERQNNQIEVSMTPYANSAVVWIVLLREFFLYNHDDENESLRRR
ncbi:hypothetical protein HO173_001858 [Letharia columbiana]|uniref:Uncharacterized protein n=1 Tax=Letharia columbiana TaxID=112416 RepID=A0A8H6G4G0_9LECA|nr:uncharacterized protein HO173_001858 [Letharia columbiana]KAF6240247.1 hypothetical protein HO173_001858 [Letharia columbiana]